MIEFAEKWLDMNRETLKDFAASQVFYDWAEMALNQGADAEKVLTNVMRYNIEGGN